MASLPHKGDRLPVHNNDNGYYLGDTFYVPWSLYTSYPFLLMVLGSEYISKLSMGKPKLRVVRALSHEVAEMGFQGRAAQPLRCPEPPVVTVLPVLPGIRKEAYWVCSTVILRHRSTWALPWPLDSHQGLPRGLRAPCMEEASNQRRGCTLADLGIGLIEGHAGCCCHHCNSENPSGW